MTFPAASGVAAANVLLSGTKTLYVSADGNLFLGGSSTGYDMFVGIKAVSGTLTQPSGIYFTSILENDAGTGGVGIYASEGSVNEVNTTLELAHERANYPGFLGYDLTYSDGGFALKPDGTSSFTANQYAVSAGANFAIGSGVGSNYQLALYVKANPVSGTGVFLNPRGVVNAANNLPFTAQVSPGELITLNGTGLYSGQLLVAASLPFPTSLGGVKATVSWGVNGTTPSSADMPLYYVSPNAIAAIVPYGIPADGSFLAFQVNNNGIGSNQAVSYSGLTQPGVFTLPPGGVGNGAILHADFTLVSTASPAKIGETVLIYLTGLGTVNQPVAAGAAGPTNPLALVKNNVDVSVDGVTAKVLYQGLAPQLAGLYQLNVTIPAGVTTGSSVTLEIITTDADNFQASIPIGK
jgi:uncharacterized protein (TIGR03437 family)